MGPRSKLARHRRHRRFWRRLRRWTALVLLGLVLGLTFLGLYFNKVDLPKPFKDLFLAELASHGWKLEFSRMRLRWYRGLVIEDVRLQHALQPNLPTLLAEEAQIRIDRLGLWRLEPKIDAILLRDGQFIWMSEEQVVRATNVEFKLHRLDTQTWDLDSLRAQLLGVSIQLNGTLTNASHMAHWPWPRPKKPARPAPGLEHWLNLVSQFQFNTNALLVGSWAGDGRSPATFHAQFQLSTPDLRLPWGNLTNLTTAFELFPAVPGEGASKTRLLLAASSARAGPVQLGPFRCSLRALTSVAQPTPTNVLASATVETLHHPLVSLTNLTLAAELQPPSSARWPLGEANLVLGAASTPWGRGQSIRSLARWTAAPDDPKQTRSELSLGAQSWSTRWTTSGPTQLRFQGTHPIDQIWPQECLTSIDAQQVQGWHATSQTVEIQLAATLPTLTNLLWLTTNLTDPEQLAELPLDLRVALGGFDSEKLQADELDVQLNWQWPIAELHTTNRLYNGVVELEAEADLSTRWARFQGQCAADFLQATALLSTNAQNWLSKYAWPSPPRLYGSGQLQLPAWTNRAPDWRREVLPTLSLLGGFQIGAGAYRDVSFDGAQSPCSLTNLLWRLHDLEIARPEGVLHAAYQSHVRDQNFIWDLHGTFDPHALLPLFNQPWVKKRLDELQFTTAPQASGQITGQWGHPELLSASGRLSASNLVFRQQAIGYASTAFSYTNQFVSLVGPQVVRPNETGAAEGIAIDARRHRLYLTNAFGNLNPHAVAFAIGDRAAQTIAPYQFDAPPTVRVQGYVDTRRESEDTELVFEVVGGPFHWKRCHLDQILGQVVWSGRSLLLTNVHGQIGSGQVEGDAHFDFNSADGAQFGFTALAREVELRRAVETFFLKTNDLEGLFSGSLLITNAHTADTKSWMGSGRAYLRDGLIWDIPILGVFSPLLNAFIPGLGNSHARQAVATFTVSNSVAWTEDLAIDATAMRMQYEGAIGFDGRVHGRMQAELLRNMPGIGLVLSRVLWPVTKIFEYRITGTLNKPRTEPVWIIPRILFLPFNPIKTFRDLLPEEDTPP